MGMLVILAALSTGSIITYEGIKVISGNIYHTYLGFVTTCFITIVVGVGVIALYKEGEDKFDPTILDFIRGAHKVSGWLLIVATRIVLYV